MTNHTTTEAEAQNHIEPTYYDSMYEYVQDADISHYRMSGIGDEEYRIEAFNPSDDPDFAINYDNTTEHDGKTYISVCWGEEESSALLESEIYMAQCYIVYRLDELAQTYVSDGTVYETREAAELVKIVAELTDTQYYCLKCEQVFEYRDIDQHGCEQCNAAIDDDNVAGRL